MMRLNDGYTVVNVRNSRERFLAKPSDDFAGRLQISKPATCLELASVSAIMNPRSRSGSLFMLLCEWLVSGNAILHLRARPVRTKKIAPPRIGDYNLADDKRSKGNGYAQ